MKSLMLTGTALLSAAVWAADYEWVGTANDWRNVKSYRVNGVEATQLPTREDTIVLNKGAEAVVDDSTVGFFSSVKAVRMSQEDTHFTVTIQNDADFGCAIGDLTADGSQTNQLFIKDGPGKLTFTDPGLDYARGAYAHNTGLRVKQGTLDLGVCAGAGINHTYKQLIVDASASLLCLTNGSMYFKGVSGGGTIVGRRPNSAAQPKLFFKEFPNATLEANFAPSVFSGKITGDFNLVGIYGKTWFTGTASDFTGDARVYGYQASRLTAEVGFVALGDGGSPSSLGPCATLDCYKPVVLRYVGETPTTVTRNLTLTDTADYPTTLDGGTVGGVTWAGSLIPKNNSQNTSGNKQERLNLTGRADSAENVLSGNLTRINSDVGTCSFYLRKTGDGVWRIPDVTATSKMSGVVGVDGGTLKFDVVRPGGLPCSLGTALDCYEDKWALVSELNRVPYASFVGGATTEAVFAYTGTAKANVYDRPLAVSGLGRLVAPNCTELWWRGIRGLGEGEKRLTVECAAGQTIRLADVTDAAAGAEGTLSLVKEGPGDLVLSGTLPFGGDLVARGGGTLTVRNPTGEKLTYYRLNLKDTVGRSSLPEYTAYASTSRSVALSEFGLYAADGTRVNLRDTNATNDDLIGLEEGKSTLENGDLMTLALSGSLPMHCGYLYDNSTSSGYNFKTAWTDTERYPRPDRPETWVRTVTRLKSTDSPVASFDLCFLAGTNARNFGENPTSFSIEGSSDGQVWEELYATNNLVFLPPDYYFWLSSKTSAFTNTAFSANNKMKPELAAHGRIPLPHATMTGSYDTLGNVRSVSVASGTTLAYAGAAPLTVAGLRVNTEEGLGTIRNFALAENGALYVDNVEDAKNVIVPGDLSGVEGLSHAANWSLYVNGELSTRYKCKATASGIRLSPLGLIVIFR